ncbi:IS3 family transposase [Mycolicibacterium sp. OfavD-34-C]|uniref:IS3 family transposase n=1 Tax=Mycolicibacterium sp. OfavD-34-C TaxID=2917746 RepID=UPI001EF4A2AB|nr:IS3 family transposase [Mycolicibacterium sp. OfavD-34-C]MCG7582393.1 IS3 family transposase [Mycolicibacterium sp. OfavD-34-C]
MSGGSSRRYPPELRERAVRMVAEISDQHESEWAAMGEVARLLGIGTAETVRKWVRQAQVDAGARPGTTTEESAELKKPRRENAELKRANAILKTASGFLRGRAGPATPLICRFIAEHQGRREGPDGLRWGVQSICSELVGLGVQIAPSTYYEHLEREPTRREVRDEALKAHVNRVHGANYGVYGARKVWLALNREGIEVARCTVERLMAELGLRGAVRGKAIATTIADAGAVRPADLVGRRFGPVAPNRLWVADLTYVSTWSGFAYVAFVTDAYARRILGWRVASTMATTMVLDSIEQAIWTRERDGILDLKDVVHHTDRGSQYTSIRFTERLAEARIQPSVGAVGSSYDNALAETINGLYKTELIKPGKPWRTVEDVELATARWVDWFNHRRLYEYCGDVPPAELEAAYYAQQTRPAAS